jgi:hypothetical protein
MGFEIAGETIAEEVFVDAAVEEGAAWTAADAAAMGTMTEGVAAGLAVDWAAAGRVAAYLTLSNLTGRVLRPGRMQG